MGILWVLWAIIALTLLGLVAGIIGWMQSNSPESRSADNSSETNQSLRSTSIGCCGMHQTCERDSLLAAVSTSIIYYDDEELDFYQNVPADSYSDEAVEEFREILISLREDDVAGWVRSLQLRGIEIPEALKPELFLIIEENRAYHMEHGPHAKVTIR